MHHSLFENMHRTSGGMRIPNQPTIQSSPNRPRILSPLPSWIASHQATARYMPLDGSALSGLDVSVPPALRNAVPKRIGEYRAGRTCAHAAISAMDTPVVGDEIQLHDWPILGPDRAPIWPSGITGSLTHSDAFVICVIAASTSFYGIGVDLEPATPDLEMADIADSVCRPEERALVANTCWSASRVTVLFSAKEAIFKALYPSLKRFVGFDEVRLTSITNDVMVFDALPDLASQIPTDTQLSVSVSKWQNHVLTFCARPRIP